MEGKAILISGSSQGIGAATARLAKERGATVVVHGRTDSEHLQAIAKELDAFKLVCDVADEEAVASEVARMMEHTGRIDMLVTSAGVAGFKPFLEMNDADWDENQNVNVLGTIHFIQNVIPHMQKQGGGAIVTISSIRGISSMTSDRGVSYSMSKASVIALTSSLAKQYAPEIRINSIAPGFTETEMAHKNWNDKVWDQARSCLLGRTGKPEEIASAVMFLASDDASFVTGQTMVIDGGYELSGK